MSALFACAARRARAPGARAAACTAARPRGQPRAGGSPPPTPGARPRRGSPGATPVRPAGLDLREDALAELVPGTREREGDVRVEVLEASAPAFTYHRVLDLAARVPYESPGGELPTPSSSSAPRSLPPAPPASAISSPRCAPTPAARLFARAASVRFA